MCIIMKKKLIHILESIVRVYIKILCNLTYHIDAGTDSESIKTEPGVTENTLF